MKKNNNKKKWIAAATTLAAIAAMAGTFAWFTSETSANNHFEGEITGNDVEIIETFNPPTDWKPGGEVNKDVAVQNTGNFDQMIRVSFKETLQKLADATSKFTNDPTQLPADRYIFPFDETSLTGTWTDAKVNGVETIEVDGQTLTFKVKEQSTTNANGATTYQYASYWESTDGKKYYAKAGGFSREGDTITPHEAPKLQYVDLTYADAETLDWIASGSNKPLALKPNADGTLTLPSPLDNNVELNFVNLSETPKANSWYYNPTDGYFYYVGIVKSQQQTAQLLDSVTLSSNAGNDYNKFKYDLTVNAKGIQATKEAVNSNDWVNNTDTALQGALEGLY